MKRKTKLVVLLCTLLIAVLSFNSVAWANIFVGESEKENNTSLLTGVGKIVSGGVITVDGAKNSLYKVFDNQEDAINDIYKKFLVYWSI